MLGKTKQPAEFALGVNFCNCNIVLVCSAVNLLLIKKKIFLELDSYTELYLLGPAMCGLG